MIAGGNWWRANEIVMRHLTRQPDARYRSRDKAGRASQRSGRPVRFGSSGRRQFADVCRGAALFEFGIVGIAMGAAAIDRLLTHQRVERGVFP